MAKITRYTGNLPAFGSTATGTNRTVFNDVTQSDALDDNINSDFQLGWEITGVNDAPTKQDFNALGFTQGQLLAYLHQAGVAEYDSTQEYFIGSVVNYQGQIYKSTAASNIGNTPGTLSASWMVISGVILAEDFDDIRALDVTTIFSGQSIAITDAGIADNFTLRNVAAHGLTDNGGTIIVIDADWYAERVYSGAVRASWFGALFDGVTDDSAAWQLAWDSGFTEIIGEAGSTVIGSTVSFTSRALNTFNQGPQIIGAGIDETVFINTVDNGPMFDVSAGGVAGTNFLMGSKFKGFKIIKSGTRVGQVGIKYSASYMVDLDQVHIDGLTGHGIEIPTIVGDNDGSNMVKMRQTRIENCSGWGIKSDGDAGFNEFSFFDLDQVFIQGCGTDEWVAITGITQANPAVVTAPGHGRSNGDVITTQAITGMVEANDLKSTVANATSSTFELSGVDSTAFTAYTSGGVTGPYIPSSGGMIWKGQIFTMNQVAFTLNQNCGLFIKGGSGLGQSVDIRGSTIENNYKRNLLCTGVKAFKSAGLQQYNNDATLAYVGVEFDGDDSVVSNVQITGTVVRATSGNSFLKAFKIGGTNTDLGTCSVDNTSWDDFDYAGQTRYEGWKDKPTVIGHKTSAQSVFNTTSAIIFNVADSDEQSILTTTNGRLTVPYAGIFNIQGRLTMTSLDANAAVTIRLYDVTNAAIIGEVIRVAAGVTTESFSFDFTLPLGASGLDRAYEIRAIQSSVGSKALDVSNVSYNTLTCRRLDLQV